MSPSEGRRTAYVLKMYPRFSETFIVNEVLAAEAAGADLEIFSLRPPADGRFHESLAQVRGRVTYLRSSGLRAGDVWDTLGHARAELPGLAGCLDELLQASVVDAVQSLELARLVRVRGITHLHAHFASVATTVARLASLLTGVPFSFTAHAKDIFHESVEPADVARKLADASAVVTVSDYNLAFLRQAYGPAADVVTRVYNGLDLERFAYASPAERPPVIAAVGRLVEKKGFADLVDAVALLVADGRDLRVDLVGSGPLEAALREQVSARGLQDVVRMPGPLPQGQVRDVVSGAAAFAAPCVVGSDGNRDGLPTVLLEAMALGTPCVATPVTGIPEAVRDGDTGLLVPEADPVALAAALARLLDDGALRVRLAERARALVEQEFDAARAAAMLQQVFEGSAGRPVLSGSGGTRMRVAYVCTDPGIPVFGSKGASVHAQSVLGVLLARGAAVDLLTPRPGGLAPEVLGAVRVHELPAVPKGTPAEREQAARDSDAAVADVLGRLHGAGPIDLVYERYSLWGRTATAWAAAAGVPSVLEVNAPLVDEQAAHRQLVGRATAQQVAVDALSAATAAVCVSDEVAAWARAHSARPDRVHVVPNGVAVDRITPSPRQVASAHAQSITLGFVGTLKPWHGVDTLLDALSLLEAEAPGAHRLLLVGDGPQAPLLRERALALGVSHLVEMTGAVAPADVPALLHRMDVAVAPYPALEQFYFSPLKVYEYLAAGLPIVASRIGQVAAALDDGRLGVLVEPGSSTALAAALRALSADPQRRRALARAGRAAAVERHSWDGVVERVLSLVAPVAA